MKKGYEKRQTRWMAMKIEAEGTLKKKRKKRMQKEEEEEELEGKKVSLRFLWEISFSFGFLPHLPSTRKAEKLRRKGKMIVLNVFTLFYSESCSEIRDVV